MTPSKRAKSLGLKSLAMLAEKTGIPERTLKDWNYKKTEAFERLCVLVRKAEACDMEMNDE
ncbi:hypothetical protein phiP47_047 [Plesiomonas phage phiP4-7]|nr:hypothetical protein phiP47_047 [Plesiomonas phage phiP4-7]